MPLFIRNIILIISELASKIVVYAFVFRYLDIRSLSGAIAVPTRREILPGFMLI